MRCYQVIARDDEKVVLATRYAGTSALAREKRDELVEALGIKKKQVEIELTEVPVAKEPLIDYLNEIMVKLDHGETEGDE